MASTTPGALLQLPDILIVIWNKTPILLVMFAILSVTHCHHSIVKSNLFIGIIFTSQSQQNCHNNWLSALLWCVAPLDWVVRTDNKLRVSNFLWAINKCSPPQSTIIYSIYLPTGLIDNLKRVIAHVPDICCCYGDNKESYCQFHIHKSFTTFP